MTQGAPTPFRGDPAITPHLVREHNLTDGEYERITALLGRMPTFAELGVFSALWSEHCSYKHSRPVLKTFPTTGPQVVQGPGENAGVLRLPGGWAVAFKIESHNHPSAVEPYQGAATGVGGILRDVFTMGARPVREPTTSSTLPTPCAAALMRSRSFRRPTHIAFTSGLPP